MSKYSAYWAKTDRENPDSALWRPFAWHVAAVVACAERLCILQPLKLHRIATMMNTTKEEALKVVVVAAALHDLGKLHCLFQVKNLDGFQRTYGTDPTPYTAPPRGQQRPDDRRVADNPGWFHGTDGDAAFEKLYPWNPDVQRASHYGSIHHGTAPERARSKNIHSWVHQAQKGGWPEFKQDVLAMQDFVRDVLQFHGADLSFPKFPKFHVEVGQIIAGIVSVADWLGSNEKLFPCLATWDVHDYATAASNPDLLQAAREHLSVAFEGLRPSSADILDKNPSALQAGIARYIGAMLSIIEAPTGDGKTEASECLSRALVNAGHVDKIVFCLQTQATSTSMHVRLRKSIARVYNIPESRVNLHHGDSRGRLRALHCNVKEDEVDSAHFGWKWFTSGKRALLAPAAVVTIDQILMMALKGHRHAFVRQMALSTAHVIIDEVHDLDTYMEGVLAHTLDILASSGCRVTLLSATLTDRSRQALLNAYMRGLKKDKNAVAPPAPKNPEATRVTAIYADGWVDGEGFPSRRKDRDVRVQVWKHRWESRDGFKRPHRDDVLTVLQSLVQTVRDGGCAGWIRNTVWDVQEVVGLVDGLIQQGDLSRDQVVFLHASLCPEERSGGSGDGGKEGVLRDVLGPDGARRRPILVIGTSLLGVSLDIDFDRLVVDLNTMDNIMQAGGRLHRHERTRPPGCLEKVLEAFVPSEMSARTIYDLVHTGEAYPLYQTWDWLLTEPTFTDPKDVRELLESTLSSVEPDKTHPAHSRWLVDQKVEESLKKWVKGAVAYRGRVDPYSEGTRRPTRLGDSSATLLMVRKNGTTITVPHLLNAEGLPETLDIGPLMMLDPEQPWKVRDSVKTQWALWKNLAQLVKRGGARRSTFAAGEVTVLGDADMLKLTRLWNVARYGTQGTVFVPVAQGQEAGAVLRTRENENGTTSSATFNVAYLENYGLLAVRQGP